MRTVLNIFAGIAILLIVSIAIGLILVPPFMVVMSLPYHVNETLKQDILVTLNKSSAMLGQNGIFVDQLALVTKKCGIIEGNVHNEISLHNLSNYNKCLKFLTIVNKHLRMMLNESRNDIADIISY